MLQKYFVYRRSTKKIQLTLLLYKPKEFYWPTYSNKQESKKTEVNSMLQDVKYHIIQMHTN
jgi:hypothetical protein